MSIPNASRNTSDRVDLPMRAFAGGFYSNLKAMYDHLGIAYHSQPFLFEFARAHSASHEPHGSGKRDSAYFIHASNLHQTYPPRPSGVATLSHIRETIYLLVCYTWFSICCFFVAPQIVQASYERRMETLDDYLKRIRLPEYFVTYYLLPLISSVTTCPHEALLEFPASDLIEYKKRTHGAPHYTVSNGVGSVQDRLIEGIEYNLNATVSAVDPQDKGVKISWTQVNGNKELQYQETFDEVVLAVAPDVVGAIFEPLRRHMSRIPTTLVESVVHTDQSTLGVGGPHQAASSRKDHDAQLIRLRTSLSGRRQTESIHVQPCGAIVTTCPFTPIDPSLTICSAKFTRVLRSPESRSIVNSIFGYTLDVGNEKIEPWRNGDGHVWLTGGWCWDGMVLLEGCVVSATRVAGELGVEAPWRRAR